MPKASRLRDRVFLPFPDVSHDIIGVTAKRGEYPLFKSLVSANIVIILEREHNVFAPPSIPTGKLGLERVRRKPPEFVLRFEHFLHKFRYYLVQFFVASILVSKARSPRHFAEKLAAPATDHVARVAVVSHSELIDEYFPKFAIVKLLGK